MIQYSKPSLILLILAFISNSAFADITGKAFNDFNGNGTLDTGASFNEVGMAGITVKAFDADDPTATPTATATSTADGSYTLTGLTATTKYRLEFSWAESWLKSGTSGGTSVQFAQDGATGIDFAVGDPNDYWDNTQDPRYVTPHYWNGLASGNSAETGVASTLYSSTGLNADYKNYDGGSGTGPIPRKDLTTAEIGSVWGAAYHKTQRHFYFTTFLKRHVGMADDAGYIYNVDYSGATPALAGKFTLQGITPSNGGSPIDFGTVTRTGSADFTLPNNKTTPNRDMNAFGKVGAMAYGDADIQPSTDYLWTINLFQQALIRINIAGSPTSTPSDVQQHILSTLPGYPTSTKGVLRPWGLTFAYGKGYLGVIDDASISQARSDLKAIVLEFDPNNITAGFTQKLSFDPNLKRQIAGSWIPFFPWINTYAEPPVSVDGLYRYRPQPVLSDMEFDENGNMYVSFFDRWGHQMGYWNYRPISGNTTTVRPAVYGEILKACKTAAGWDIEGTGACHTGTTEFIQDISGDNERESSQGAVALLKGKNQLLQISIDPHPQGSVNSTYWTTQGANTYNLSNGQISNWYSFYQSSTVEAYGKANGLGDVEFITPPAPIEIGNRVWLDTDGDGIQDADENGIPNVQVQLLSGATVLGTATTAADGTYYFSNAIGTSTASKIYGIAQLIPGAAYTIKFPTSVTVSGTTYDLTTATAGGNTLIDSNALTSGDVVVAATDIPTAGANNHTFDVGYSAAPTCNINNFTVTPICHNNGTVGMASDDYRTFTLNLSGSNTAATYNLSVNNGGVLNPTSGSYTVDTVVNMQTGSAGNSTLYTLTATDTTDNSCSKTAIINDPGSCASTGNLQISKTVSNKPAGFVSPDFTVQVDCSVDSFDQPNLLIKDGESKNITGIPTGTNCTVTEVTPLPAAPVGYGYGTPSIAPSGVQTIGTGTTLTVVITNPLNSVSCPTITLTPTPLPDGKVGTTYTASPSASANDGVTYTYNWNSTNLPTGLAVDVMTGTVSGTPSVTGNATVTASTTVAGQTCSGSTPLTITASPKIDLELKKTVDKSIVKQNDTVIYTITVTNNGPDPATGIEVTDKLPSALEYLSDDGQTTYGSDVYDDATGIWQVGNLAKDESKLLKITAKVK